MENTTPRTAILLFALVAALTMAAVAPESGNILFFVATACSLLFVRPRDLAALRRPTIWMPLVGLLVLAIDYMIGARSFGGAIGVVYFAPLIASVPLIVVAGRAAKPSGNLLAMLCYCGAAGAAAAAVSDFMITGAVRAGFSVANPIHFADVALAAGFLSLLGVVFTPSRWRYLYLLGPVFASVAVLLSGTRGAVVAIVAVALFGLVLATCLRLISVKTFILAVLGALIVGGIALFAGLSRISGAERVIGDIMQLLQSGIPTDGSTELRTQMYIGGFKAFLASPIFGYGPFDYLAAASAHAPAPFEGLPHLHNDLADFAVSGGVFGILAYGLFLFAPLVEAIRARHFAQKRGVIVVTAMLVLAYFIMGLTNAVFGILTLTVFYAAVSVVIGTLTGPSTDKIAATLAPSNT